MVEIKNHSFSNTQEVIPSHLNLNLSANFETKTLEGFAEWKILVKPNANRIVLDVRSMEISKVEIDNEPSEFFVSEEDEIFGSALIVPVSKENTKIKIYYKTLPNAEAVQWLSAEQTSGKPFLFTQSQAILARTWVPCMDLPAVRFTYNATISCPSDLLPLMSATNPQTKNKESVYTFEMPQPIPSYLLALCIGDLEFAPLGAECGVYAEPNMLAKSKAEFEDLESMIKAAESLYGPYRWGRYDLVVLPPSFPFGGMENPRLTFATPTIITGDKSLVSLVAHELAHSWSGNLVTNQTWTDFWLNEGFTVYFEDRIMEAVYGKDYADMMSKLGLGELQKTIEEFMVTRPNDTKLFLDLDGRSPDDGVTDIAYEKGRFFLLSLERIVGRNRFDAFLNKYFNAFAFKTINTEQFKSYLNENLFENAEEAVAANINEWVYETGLPESCPQIESAYLKSVDSLIETLVKGTELKKDLTQDWTTHHFLYFLRSLPAEYVEKNMSQLDSVFGFTQTQNAEIACDWFRLCVNNNYVLAKPQIEEFLGKVGRRKFLTPIYKAMIYQADWKPFAQEIFKKVGTGYHAVSYNTIKQMLEEKA